MVTIAAAIPEWYLVLSLSLTTNFIVFGVIVGGATLLQNAVDCVRRRLSTRTK